MNKTVEIAKLLLDIKAITLSPSKPYRYTSRLESPIYCDNRLIISYPDKRKIIIDAFLQLIKENQLTFDFIVGTATAGIPYAAWLSACLNLPMLYVRDKIKKHGKQNQIEGFIEKGKKALIVEDLISTGKSALTTGEILREKDILVTDCIAIFSYQLQQATENFSKARINCHTLSNFNTLIETASSDGYINAVEKQKVLAWRENPAEWKP